MKFQTPNAKSQINPKYLILEISSFGIFLAFVIWRLEFCPEGVS